MKRRGLLIILSSPSGAGKSTLARRLRAWDGDIRFSVSATTRGAREGEVDGVDYRFITEKAFKEMVAREAMLAIGCIQAQRCHTGHCPTGVATQNKWLVRGLDPEDKSHRMANYVMTLRKEILALCNACGVHHPAQIGDRHLEMIDDRFGRRSVHEVFGLREEWVTPSDEDLAHVLSK